MRLKISSRMIVGFMVMAILLVIINVVSIYYLNQIRVITERTIITENVASFAPAKELERVLMAQKGLMANYLLTADSQWLQRFNESRSNFYNGLNQAQATAYTAEEREVLANIQRSYEEFLELQRQVIDFHQSAPSAEEYSRRLDNMSRALDGVISQCEQFWDINERGMNAARAHLAETNRMATRILYGVVIGGVLLGLSLGVLIARSITRPIYELVLKVRSVTEQGAPVPNIEIANESELEQLGRSVRRLIEQIYHTNDELVRSQQNLIQSEKLAAAGELAAGIAHEILNPMTTVKMLAFAIEEELLAGDAKREDVRRIIGEIERVERVLHSFLDFARPPEPEFTALSLTQTLKNALALLHPELRKQGVRPILRAAQDFTIRADRGQITQVLINLFRNAIDAMPGGGDLRIGARSTEALLDGTRRMVQIEICDAGAGIADDLLPRLFDPFVTGKAKGTGLGLSIAYKIIESHGGWIEAKNNEGSGATFTIALPLET